MVAELLEVLQVLVERYLLLGVPVKQVVMLLDMAEPLAIIRNSQEVLEEVEVDIMEVEVVRVVML